MRKHARKDNNQNELVEQMRDLGFHVAITHQLGGGFPDIVVGGYGLNFMFEIKDPDQPPSKRRLTPDEELFHTVWYGQVDVVETIDDVLAVINDYVKGKNHD